jgi:histidinol-phosphate aminotransferase
MQVNALIKPYINDLVPYSTARDEFTGVADVYLDANENPFESAVNRYPDPHQRELKALIAKLRGVPAENIFLGNGSDEAIELLVRIVDTAQGDTAQGGVTITPPTYGMYKVAARNNNVPLIEAPLNLDFSINLEGISHASARGSKLIFICSPNNPTGRAYSLEELEAVLEAFAGIVVIDEAYSDFAQERSALTLLPKYDRLVVLQTFSKAWGMAGIRLGMAFASETVLAAMNKLKLPYNVSALTQRYALERLREPEVVIRNVSEILAERSRMEREFAAIPCVIRVHPSGGNFLLVQIEDSDRAFEALKAQGVIVRDRSKERNCDGCLRITVGAAAENERVLTVLRGIK